MTHLESDRIFSHFLYLTIKIENFLKKCFPNWKVKNT